MIYRPEITGLRAIAVIAILLFHTQISIFANGYIGVDLFFVISGYLITSLIVSKRNEDSFSLAKFYLLRMRRLLPVLFVVLLACIPFAFIWLFDYQLTNFFQSLFAASLFSSNILFLFEFQQYFSSTPTLRPLLHTWSLAVEGQFYLSYPILLLMLIRFGKQFTIAGIIVLTLLSVIYVEYFLYNRILAQYYLPQARLWLFGVGALAYFFVEKERVLRCRFAEVYAVIGMFMIVLPIFIAIDQKPNAISRSLLSWPNLSVLGVWLVIVFANQKGAVGRLLSSRLLVTIGLISYSLYLWHYPIYVFARIRFPDLSAMDYVGLTLLAVGLSYFSWKFIETPFRNISMVSSRLFLSMFGGAFLILILISVYGIKLHFNDDALFKPINEVSPENALLASNEGLANDCTFAGMNPLCQTHEQPEVLLWGDSFAMHMVDGLLISKPDIRMQQATLSACSPFLKQFVNIEDHTKLTKKRIKCLGFNSSVMEYVEKTESLRYVIISSRLSNYFYERHFYSKTNNLKDYKTASDEINELLLSLKNRGLKVVIIQEPRNPPVNNVLCAARSIKFRITDESCTYPRNLINTQQKNAQQFLDKLSENYKVISFDNILCPDEDCITLLDETAVYTRGGHLSRHGSALLGKKVMLYDLVVNE